MNIEQRMIRRILLLDMMQMFEELYQSNRAKYDAKRIVIQGNRKLKDLSTTELEEYSRYIAEETGFELGRGVFMEVVTKFAKEI